MKATFKTIKDVELDGKAYKKGETFEADASLDGHFASAGIAEIVKEPNPKAPKK